MSLIPLFVADYLTYLCVPLMTFKRETFSSSLSKSIKAVSVNFLTLLPFTVIVFCLSTLSVMLFAIPLILVYGPLSVVLPYIVYASIFERFDIDRSPQRVEQLDGSDLT